MAEAVSGILPREDKASAMRVLSLSGKSSASRSGPAVSRLIRKVSGLRRHRPGRFLGEAAMANAGALAGRRRCISRSVRSRHGALWQAAFRVAAHGAIDAAHKDHEKDVEAEACPRSWVEKKADVATGACSSADAPRGGGPKGLRLNPGRRAALILCRRVMTRRGRVPRVSCGLRVPPLVCFRLDPDKNGAPERVELS